MERNDCHVDWPGEVMEEDLCLVIQGPTTYCKQVSEYYRNYRQIWSTWNSEPEENLNYLDGLDDVILVTDDLPLLTQEEKQLKGHAPWCLERALYQFTSTYNGFKKAELEGESMAVKIRSDFLIDLSTSLRKGEPDAFNCLGWHKGSIGYLVDYFYYAPVEDIIYMLECCINMRHPSHSENVMTHVWIELMKKRKIRYCLDKDVYTYSLKHKYDTELFMGEVNKGIWVIDHNQNHDSKNYSHTFTNDLLPDLYPLTYGWGPGV